MSVQMTATIDTVPIDDLTPTDTEFTGNDYGEIPIVHDTTPLTDERAIHARQKKLNSCREAIENANITTKRDTLKRRKELVEDIKTSQIIRVPTEVQGTKRDIIQSLVDTDVSDAPLRLLSAILYASNHEAVTQIDAGSRVTHFTVEKPSFDTTENYIEATRLGDCIVIQGRCRHKGEDVCRAFPEECLQEDNTLETIQHFLDPQNGWAAF